MKNLFLFPLMLGITTGGNLQAQSASDEFEMLAFTRAFLAAYNQQDEQALQNMYAKDAVRIDPAGKEISGADKIADYFAQQFIKSNTTLLLRPSSIYWSDYEHAFVAKGTYEIFGRTHVYDIQIHDSGTYTNTMTKVNGEWKIARSVLTPYVKVMIHHQVKDFAEWKSVFDQRQGERRAAGELNSETGTLHDDPTTAYIISEWTSMEQLQSYLSDPDLEKIMQEAGVTGKPTVLILDKR